MRDRVTEGGGSLDLGATAKTATDGGGQQDKDQDLSDDSGYAQHRSSVGYEPLRHPTLEGIAPKMFRLDSIRFGCTLSRKRYFDCNSVMHIVYINEIAEYPPLHGKIWANSD